MNPQSVCSSFPMSQKKQPTISRPSPEWSLPFQDHHLSITKECKYRERWHGFIFQHNMCGLCCLSWYVCIYHMLLYLPIYFMYVQLSIHYTICNTYNTFPCMSANPLIYLYAPVLALYIYMPPYTCMPPVHPPYICMLLCTSITHLYTPIHPYIPKSVCPHVCILPICPYAPIHPCPHMPVHFPYMHMPPSICILWSPYTCYLSV